MPNPVQTVVLGLDGGGTGTRALLAIADGSVLGFGTAGPANLTTLGTDRTLPELVAATHAAWKSAGLSPRAAFSSFAGLAGLRASGEGARLAERIEQAGLTQPGRCHVGSDFENALAGGLGGAPGIVLLVGTGSFCIGRDAAGRFAECGGWGWLIDDVGGGTFLGREALQASLRALDGRSPRTSLGQRILVATNIPNLRSLPAAVQGAPSVPAFLASLAPLVVEEARSGDTVACLILQAGASALAELAGSVVRSLEWTEAPSIVISGGLGRSGAPYEPLICEALQKAVPHARISPPLLPNAAGALLLALNASGLAATPQLVARLRTACARLGLQ